MNQEEKITHLYRYERGSYFNGKLNIRLRAYIVVKETPAGYWVKDYYKNRFVLKYGIHGKKRFAYASKDDAWDNWQRRTRKCAAILESQLERTKDYLLAERPADVSIHSLVL